MSNGMLANTMHNLLFENCYTDDMNALIHKYEYVPIFIYGREKHGFSEAREMCYWPRVGIGKTVKSGFELRYAKNDEPLAFYRPDSPVGGCLFGDIFLAPVTMLTRLDGRFENGLTTRRTYLDIIYYEPQQKDVGKKQYHVARAWLYHARLGSRWDNQQLSLAQMFKPADSAPYYCYTQADDQEYLKHKKAV